MLQSRITHDLILGIVMKALRKRRGHKRAIIAIARMLLVCIFNILSKKESFNSSLYEEYFKKNTKYKQNIDKLIIFLQSQGFFITKLTQDTLPQ